MVPALLAWQKLPHSATCNYSWWTDEHFRVIYGKHRFTYIFKIPLELVTVWKNFENESRFSKSGLKKAREVFELLTFSNWLFFRMYPKELIHLIKYCVNNYTWKSDWLQKTTPAGLRRLRLVQELGWGRRGLQKALFSFLGRKSVTFYVFHSPSSKLDSNNLPAVSTWIGCYGFNERQSCVRFFWLHFKDLFKLYEVL